MLIWDPKTLMKTEKNIDVQNISKNMTLWRKTLSLCQIVGM